MLYRWEQLPGFMRTEEVRPYYEVLKTLVRPAGKANFLILWMSSVMLIILSPVFLTLAIWIKRDSVGPVFYRQERVTQYGRRFRIYKFRTMVQNADQIGSPGDCRRRFQNYQCRKKLRGRRLDELPQLINIWKGEMTFVGTRPEVPKYVKQYTKEMYATLLLPAGVTSEASIEFKDEDKLIAEGMEEGLSADEVYVERVLPGKMRWNLDYMQKFTYFKEWKIMIKLFLLLFRGDIVRKIAVITQGVKLHDEKGYTRFAYIANF